VPIPLTSFTATTEPVCLGLPATIVGSSASTAGTRATGSWGRTAPTGSTAGPAPTPSTAVRVSTRSEEGSAPTCAPMGDAGLLL